MSSRTSGSSYDKKHAISSTSAHDQDKALEMEVNLKGPLISTNTDQINENNELPDSSIKDTLGLHLCQTQLCSGGPLNLWAKCQHICLRAGTCMYMPGNHSVIDGKSLTSVKEHKDKPISIYISLQIFKVLNDK